MAIQVRGGSLKEALGEAAVRLNTQPSNVAYELLEKKKAFLGLFGGSVHLKVWRRSSHLSGGTSRQLDAQEEEALCGELLSFCRNLCQRLFPQEEGELEIHSSLEKGRFSLDIQDPSLAAQMGQFPGLPEALEHLLRKKPRQLTQKWPFHLFVDVKGMRRKREQALTSLAKDLAQRVSSSGQGMLLDYKSSHDRKVIHQALEADPLVYSRSVGSGPHRRLLILPRKEGGLS